MKSSCNMAYKRFGVQHQHFARFFSVLEKNLGPCNPKDMILLNLTYENGASNSDTKSMDCLPSCLYTEYITQVIVSLLIIIPNETYFENVLK
jgi:hypothetical protein